MMIEMNRVLECRIESFFHIPLSWISFLCSSHWQVIKHDDKQVKAYFRRGTAHFTLKDYDKAKKDFEKTLVRAMRLNSIDEFANDLLGFASLRSCSDCISLRCSLCPRFAYS